jgi:formate/nitrite transporter
MSVGTIKSPFSQILLTMNDFKSVHSAKASSASPDEGGVPTKGPVENEGENKSSQTDPELAASPDQANFSEPYTICQAFTNNLATMVSKPSTKEPPDALQAVYAAGKSKADLTLDILVIQSFMAGLYLGMASHLYLAIGGGVLGAVFFPTSLIAVLLTSAELFTGDALIFVAAVLGGQVSIRSLCRNWTISWICNMAGCLAWAYFMVYLPDSLKDVDKEEYAIEVALRKAYQPWGTIFLKGIGGNFMVCLGVWQSSCAEDVSGKVLAMSFPIAGFVIIGFDNIIANQFFIRKLPISCLKRMSSLILSPIAVLLTDYFFIFVILQRWE